MVWISHEDFRTTYAGLKADRKPTTAQSLSLQKDARYQAVSNAVYRASLVVGQPSRLIRKRFEEHYARSRYVAMPVFEDLLESKMARFMEQGSTGSRALIWKSGLPGATCRDPWLSSVGLHASAQSSFRGRS